MAKQSRLEQDAISARKEQTLKNEFKKGAEEYSAQSEKAKTHDDEKNPHGKGTNHGGHTHIVPDAKKSKIEAINKFRDEFDRREAKAREAHKEYHMQKIHKRLERIEKGKEKKRKSKRG